MFLPCSIHLYNLLFLINSGTVQVSVIYVFDQLLNHLCEIIGLHMLCYYFALTFVFSKQKYHLRCSVSAVENKGLCRNIFHMEQEEFQTGRVRHLQFFYSNYLFALKVFIKIIVTLNWHFQPNN